MTHAVEHDRSFTGHDRLTCVVCEKTLVRQPWMNDEIWKQQKELFLKEHREERTQEGDSK